MIDNLKSNTKHKNSIIFTGIIYIFLIFIPAAISAVDKEENTILEKINISEAVRIALEKNHEYRITSHKVKKAEESVNQSWGQLMPILESEASAARQYAENGFTSLSDGQNDIRFVQARLIINPGIFYNSLQLSRKSLVAAREEKRRIRNEVTYSVIKSYFDVISAGETINMRAESITALRENERTVSNNFKIGNVTKYELMQAEVKRRSQEPLLIEAENRHRIAIEQFNYHLGVDGLKYMVVTRILDTSTFRLPKGGHGYEINRLITAAMAGRPEMIQIKIRKEISGHKRELAGSYYLWPTFSLTGSYGMTQNLVNDVNNSISTPVGPVKMDMSSITGNKNWQNTWQIRAAATYRWGSLLPMDTKRSETREGDEDIKESEEEFQRLKRRISLSIKSSYYNFITAYHTVMSHRESVKAAEEGLRVARDSFKVGLIKNSELLSAELDVTNAKTGYIGAVNQYYISLADLKREIGTEDDKIIFMEK